MNIKQILEIEQTLGRKIPVDMYSNMSYYSKSKEEYIDVKALDIVHAIRILRKYIREENE